MEIIRAELRALGSPSKAVDLRRFFKTGPGDYGEGDVFLGVRVPDIRVLARTYRDLSLDSILDLLRSDVHEERMMALCILVRRFGLADAANQGIIYRAYLKNARHINNWDLVDTSAPQIVGGYLYQRGRAPLFRLARSKSLWNRRIAILATFYFIRQMDFQDTLQLADLLLEDREDLIHKAVGWMIREIGNRNHGVALEFLEHRCKIMPRTMLRYAIEKFPPEERRRLMA